MFRIDNYGAIWYNYNIRLVRENDFVAIANEYGDLVAEYTYDAWGNFSITYYNSGEYTKATYNPFRYRGYYYDTELGFYYLNSRYYDPAIGRFITADKLSTVKATSFDLTYKNLCAYCGNNPVMYSDPTGKWLNKVLDFLFVKPVKSFFSAIEVEVGFGDGLEVEVMDLGGGQYVDTVIGFDDGETYTGHVSSTDIPLGPVSFNKTKMHYSEIGGERISCDSWEKRTYTHIDECETSQEAIAFSFGPFTLNSELELIVSASISGHLFIGGHASIGFNITEYYERWLFS